MTDALDFIKSVGHLDEPKFREMFKLKEEQTVMGSTGSSEWWLGSYQLTKAGEDKKMNSDSDENLKEETRNQAETDNLTNIATDASTSKSKHTTGFKKGRF